jgi:hypothetical protein
MNNLPKSSTVSDVRQIEIHTSEPSPFEVEIGTENLNRYKSSGIFQIPAGVIQSGGETLISDVHNIIKNCLSNGRNLLL